MLSDLVLSTDESSASSVVAEDGSAEESEDSDGTLWRLARPATVLPESVSSKLLWCDVIVPASPSTLRMPGGNATRTLDATWNAICCAHVELWHPNDEQPVSLRLLRFLIHYNLGVVYGLRVRFWDIIGFFCPAGPFIRFHGVCGIKRNTLVWEWWDRHWNRMKTRI